MTNEVKWRILNDTAENVIAWIESKDDRIAELEAMDYVQECKGCQQKYYPRIRGDKCPHCEINRKGRKIVELEESEHADIMHYKQLWQESRRKTEELEARLQRVHDELEKLKCDWSPREEDTAWEIIDQIDKALENK